MNPEHHPHHYLVIDDNEVFATTLAKTLTRTRNSAVDQPVNRVTCCQTADQALQQNRLLLPDRVVLDLKLKHSSGLALITTLKLDNPTVTIVVLTGYSSITTAVEAIKLGAHQYLCKPASVAEITHAFDHPDEGENVALADRPPSVNRLQWEHIQKVLQQHDGNISATARALGMHRRTLQRKLIKKPTHS